MSKPVPTYRIGDLVWCRWGSVWWPAMISYDPHMAVYFKTNNEHISAYHLQYFGIMARRAWVNCKLILPLKSLDEKKLAKKLNRSNQKDYEVAMSEVTEAFGLDLKHRKLKFIFNFVPTQKRKGPPTLNKRNNRTHKSRTNHHLSSSSKPSPVPTRNELTSMVTVVPPPTNVPVDTSIQTNMLVPVTNSFVSSGDSPEVNTSTSELQSETPLLPSSLPLEASLPENTCPLEGEENTLTVSLPVTSLNVSPSSLSSETTRSSQPIPPFRMASDSSPAFNKIHPICENLSDSSDTTLTTLSCENVQSSKDFPSFDTVVKDVYQPASLKAMCTSSSEITQPSGNMSEHTSSSSKIIPSQGNTHASPSNENCSQSKDPLLSVPEEAQHKDQTSAVAEPTRRYPLRRKSIVPVKKPEELGSLSAHDSQGTDSGFETSSDLSVTPLLPTPTLKSPLCSLEPAESTVDNGSHTTKRKPTSTKWNNAEYNRVLTPLNFNRCAICDNNNGDIVTCSGHCFQGFHLDCLGIMTPPTNGFCCDECLIVPTICFLCKKPQTQEGEPLVPCDHRDCDKHYHFSCVYAMKTFAINGNKLICGLHSCAKCVGTEASLSVTKLLQCVRCPMALHKMTCLMAGCEVLNDKQMICYFHVDIKSASLRQSIGHFNMNTCLECGEAGSLICCDFCSAAYHVECLSDKDKPPPSLDKWFCPCCVSYDLPTYGSVVMCKCGSHRWWPAEVIPDRSVPNSLRLSKPTACMFLVRFFGTEQYFWTHHGRVIAFTEDCLLEEHKKKRIYSNNTKQGQIQAQYSEAFEEALLCYREWKNKMEGFKQHKKESKSFTLIRRNKYLVPRPPVDLDVYPEPCKCTPKSSCSPSSNCINRAIYTECLPDNCPAGSNCQNQKIRLAQNAPVETFYTGGRGWGLKSTENIVSGDFVVEYIGEVLNMGMVRERLKRSDEKNVSNFYFLTLGKNLVIDASSKSNNARFINHSCDPNCQTQKWKVNGETRIGIFAIKDIPTGTELTFDYMLDSLGNEKKKCLCGSRNCSGFLGVRPKNAQEMADMSLEMSPASRKRKSSAVVFSSKLCKTDPYDDECFVCKKGGKLLMCDYPDCCCAYHTGCVNLKRVPKGDFFCPRHRCVICSSPSSVFCTCCPSAYCQDHQDNLIEMSNSYLCTANCFQSEKPSNSL